MQIKKVGVIGAGQMGNGIAHVLSLGGYKVILMMLIKIHSKMLLIISKIIWKDR